MKNTHAKHGGNIWNNFENQLIADGNLTDFSTNTNPLGFPEEINKIIFDNIPYIKYYPDPDCIYLRHSISEHLNINYKNIITGNGSSELFYNAINAIKPSKILLLAPSFSEYEKASKSSNASVSYIYYERKDNEFYIGIKKILKKLPGTDVLIIGNPNNPTGSIIEHEDLIFLVKKSQENNCFVFIDEAFIDFMEDRKNISLIKNIVENNNIIIFRSLTKIFSIPGLRLGYAVANRNLIEKIRAHQSDWPVNIIAQSVGAELVKNEDFIKKTIKVVEEERHFLYSCISEIKSLKPYKSHANFLIIEILKTGLNSKILKSKLFSKNNILIRDCSNFRNLGNAFFRIAVKTRSENEKLISALRCLC
ncbi:MAG: pyridoxal phosphate-dependent aminotransferase [Candidatus Humimicrobiaceae bacterium]